MKVLVIGSGGREHAICDAFRNSARVESLFCANGNAGIAKVAECAATTPNSAPAKPSARRGHKAAVVWSMQGARHIVCRPPLQTRLAATVHPCFVLHPLA